jgi:molybdenum-dependent DNA-binding transcriptional regulator ModE
MTQRQYIINRKLNILDLGRTLGNISEACRKLGVSRQHYYDIRKALNEDGLEALMEKTRTMPRQGNRVRRFLPTPLIIPRTGKSGLPTS